MAVLVYIATILGSLFFVFLYPLQGNRKSGPSAALNETMSQNITAAHTTLVGNDTTPICVGNLLDQRQFRYEKGANGVFDSSRLTSQTGVACRLRQYVAKDVMACFDGIISNRKRLPQMGVAPIGSRHQELRFMFMGDSRIRQQYFNFIELMPDYEKQSFPHRMPLRPQVSLETTSNILGVRVSFKWHPFLNDDVIETVRQWATTLDPLERPCFIFLSITSWHMLRNQGADHQVYQKKLIELGPLLGRLANVSQVIWLHQYPSIDFYPRHDGENTDIASEKIHAYNTASRRILESLRTRIRIWDSSNPLAEEYVRGCAILKRSTETPNVDDNSDYYNCDDPLHTGYAALSQATQLLFNDICNSQTEC